jgi:ketosteroid isomerase-like protein
MSRENVELIQRGLARFMTTGEPQWEMFDQDVEIYDHDTPDQGAYRGHAGVARWLEEWGAAWAAWSIEPEEFIDAADSVVVFIRMKTRGRGSGVEIERHDAQVWRLRSGKVVRGDYYNDRQQALEAVGLAE